MIYIEEENPSDTIGTSFLKVTWLEPKIFQIKKIVLTKIFPSCRVRPGMGDFSWNQFLNGNNFGSNQCIFKNEVHIDSGWFLL